MMDSRLLGAPILDSGDWMHTEDVNGSVLAQMVQALGLQDLWNSGYSKDTSELGMSIGGPEGKDTYSPELAQALSQYQFNYTGARPGEDDKARHLVATKDGQPVWDNTYKYSHWSDAPIEAAKVLGSAYLGMSALNGGLLGMGAAEGAAGAAGAAGGATEGFSLGGGMLDGLTAPGISTGAGMSGMSGAGGTSGLGGAFGGALSKYAPQAAQWIAQNPNLAKGLFSLGTGLLSAGGGSSGGGEPSYGPPKQWTAPLQQGLIGNPQLTNVAKPVSFKGRW